MTPGFSTVIRLPRAGARLTPFLFLLFLAFGACQREQPVEMKGSRLARPLAKPDVVLTDTAGKAFDFRKETEGKLTLLFFGFTNCPDICPVHLANVADVVDDLSFEQQSNTRVVFVTVDPQRDTPAHMRKWLDNFDARFIGLYGDDETVNRFQDELLLARAVTIPTEGGGYTVGHASQMIAFSPDGLARYVYPFGTRQSDWAHDLPRLFANGKLDAGGHTGNGKLGNVKVVRKEPIRIEKVKMPAPAPGSPGVMYATIINEKEDDALLAVETPVAGRVELHTVEKTPEGHSLMKQVKNIPVPARRLTSLKPGGYHVMLMERTADYAQGQTVPATFVFEKAGRIAVQADVISYGEVEHGASDGADKAHKH